MNWLTLLKSKLTQANRQAIRLEFSDAEASRLKAIAKLRGVRITELMRRAVLSALTTEEAIAASYSSVINTAMAGAFSKLDEAERTFGGGDVGTLTVLAPESADIPILHSCVFLNPSVPQPYKPGECEGLCKHPEQPGKICFFKSESARSCPLYQLNKKYTKVTSW